MSKLWVFGDSYAYFNKHHYESFGDKHWIPIVANRLVKENFTVIGHHGAANEWIFYQLRTHLDQKIGRAHV